MKKYIILASKSKRRAQILSACGIRYKVRESNIKECMDKSMSTAKLVLVNAKHKAECVAKQHKNNIILGADTLVLLKGKIIGKPKNRKQALSMLKQSSASKLYVYTGMYLLNTKTNKSACCYDKTLIKVSKIGKNDINKYFKHLGPYDKAGGFTIEGIGAVLFDNITGSYFNALGLPLNKLDTLLKKMGSSIFEFI